jgi:relaxase-like protein
MPPRVTRLGSEEPLLNIHSFARRGREDRIRLHAQVEQIARTVRGVPEVVVKVSGGARSTKGAIAHLQYIDRHGTLEIETDEGQSLQGKNIERELVSKWDLDSSEAHIRSPFQGRSGRKPTKLVHNVILSMPKATSPEKLLEASCAFAREQFGSQHRYGLVLHSDQDHPHVHLVIKAVSEQGTRLNIRKATLRDWRRQFARQLRAQGIAANATERAVRGRSGSALKDGVYRAAPRGKSRYLQARVEKVFDELRSGRLKPTAGKAKLLETRGAVQAGWLQAADALAAVGHGGLAEKIRGFVAQIRPPLSTDEQLALHLLQRARARELERTLQRTR